MKPEKMNQKSFVVQGKCFNFTQAWGTIKELSDGGLIMVMSVGDTVIIIGALPGQESTYCDASYNEHFKDYFDQTRNYLLKNWPGEALAELQQLVEDHIAKRKSQTGRELTETQPDIDIEDLFRPKAE